MSTFSANDHHFMARALHLAKKGLYTTHPNPRVGCVVVKQGVIIGEGWHEKAGQAHAEVNALANLSAEQSRDATAYVTLEPCSFTGKTPPCSQALINAQVKRVVVAMQDPNPKVSGKGLQQLNAAGIETASGLMEAASRALNPGYIKRMEQGLPWVSVKLAMSLDGRTAMASGESHWITAAAARRDVQFLRAKASAILTGQGTLLADDPALNVRLQVAELGIEEMQVEVRQPVRIVLDPELKISPDAKLLKLKGKTLVFTHDDTSEHAQALQQKGVKLIAISTPSTGRLPLHKVMQKLAELEMNEIHVEAGASLCGALFQADLVDELVIYMAPHLMGSAARGLLNLPGLENMRDRINLHIIDVRAIGNDWRIIACPQRTSQ